MVRVLLVADEPEPLAALCVAMHAQGCEVVVPTTARMDPGQMAALMPDLVVLDLGIAVVDGNWLIDGLRYRTQAPVIALSGEDGNRGRVAALDAGADHFVTRPFTADDVAAHVRAGLRRLAAVHTEPRTEPIVLIGDHLVDLDAKTITDRHLGAATVHLTPTEWRILEILVHNPGKMVSVEDLLRAVKPHTRAVSAGYLRQYMRQLRTKLEPEPAKPRHLVTEPGMGYRFQPAPQTGGVGRHTLGNSPPWHTAP